MVIVNDPQGYLGLVLHAHLPFVREPRHERFLEENWFYENVTETYLPLLLMLEDLVRDGVDFRLTISLTPSLVSMFRDELLQERYEARLDELIDLAETEHASIGGDPARAEVARFYHERFSRLRSFYRDDCQRDLTAVFRRLQDRGVIELLTSAATHGFLPLLRHEPSSVETQVELGVQYYRECFGRQPQGFWLPECGYYPGLEAVLHRHGILYFILEAHGVLHGSSRARHGLYAPLVCPNGVAAFGRDPECSRQVWSAEEGFPGHPDYREFYRDIGFDRPLEEIAPYIGPDGIRTQTGIKYHRITGGDGEKEVYVRARAMQRAVAQAGQFLQWRREQIEWLAERMDRRPFVVAPYDAELFGHWWFEGPEWLGFLLRKIAFEQHSLVTATPSEYLAEYPGGQVSQPGHSSWGQNGFNQVWLNRSNDWMYPRLHRVAETMSRLAHVHRGASGGVRRLLNQAGREALLSQASDWAFILKTDTATEFATRRVEESIGNFDALVAPLLAGGGGGSEAGSGAELPAETLRLVADLEERDSIFRDFLQFEVFAPRAPRDAASCPLDPRHVVFLSAEAVPFVKVGGLADVAGALPAALASLGVRVTLILPAYRSIDREKHGVRPLRDGCPLRVGAEELAFRVLEARSPADGVRVLLIEQQQLFGRDGVYVDPSSGAEYPDTDLRFVFFTRAALEALRLLREPVDVLHSHDHQTALAGSLLKMQLRQDPVLGLAASVYTLHNLGYQGVYGPEVLDLAGFSRDVFRPGSGFEHFGRVNFMKLGIEFADKVNTVSECYAREICEDPVHIGAGLGDVLARRGRDFTGILNGIDTVEWNPAGDGFLPATYDADDLSGKHAAKRKLFETVGLDAAHIDAPLVGMISRLVDQKGFDLVEARLGRILETGVSLVVLGTGLPRYEEFLRQAAARHPGRLAAEIRYDNALAHLIEAGADMFLMPSLYEPCGLNQIYSLRYGTVPIVRHTGGLADTVPDADRNDGDGVGFSFRPYDGDALVDALERAVQAYRDPGRWRQLVRRGMARDHSWGASALRYLELYRDALRCRS